MGNRWTLTLHWSRTMPEWAAALQWPSANCRKPGGRGASLGKRTWVHPNQWVLCWPPHDASLLTAQDKFISVPKSKRWLSQQPTVLLHAVRHSPFCFPCYSWKISVFSSSPYPHLQGTDTDNGLISLSLRPSRPLKLESPFHLFLSPYVQLHLYSS